MTNGDLINRIISDKKLIEIVLENEFIQNLKIKNHSSPSNKNVCY